MCKAGPTPHWGDCAKTIFATNSTTLLPSSMKEATGRPNRFLALHFAHQIWKFNTAEVMGTADTSAAVFEAVVALAAAIGMVPIPVRKEKAGDVLNRCWCPCSTRRRNWRPADTPTRTTWTRSGAPPPARRWGRSRSTTSSA
ncbi:MAG: hypothetical protein LBV05_18725 [Comamonas sp.]|nr:hypothetical protein [Comamonas sp.]